VESGLVKRVSQTRWAKYGFALVAAVLALLIRFPMAPALGAKAPYLTFFVAAAASAVFGGFGPGLAATIVGALFALSFVVPDPFRFASLEESIGLARFLVAGVVVSSLTGRLKEARRREIALRQHSQQTLLSIGDAVISTDDDKRVLLMNRTAEELTGWTLAEAKGKTIEEVFRIVQEGSEPPIPVPIERTHRSANAAELVSHMELISRKGSRVPIEDAGAPIRDEHGVSAGIVLVFRDISPRREAERRLQDSERRSRAILESIMDSFGLVDPDWRIAYVNPVAEKMTGRSAYELIGKNLWELYPGALGTIIESSFKRAMAERTPVSFENYYEYRNRWFDTSAYPSDIGLSVYFRDITERKRGEQALHRLNEDLKQFTYAATHDLREPLRMMTISAQKLQRRLVPQLDQESCQSVTEIVNGGKRISLLIDGLLQFSRIGEIGKAEPTPVDTEAAFGEALLDLQIVINETNATVAHSSLPDVMADHAHVRRLFQNLVGNAIKYRKANVRSDVRVSSERQGDQCVFSVEDNGIGIDPEHYDHIYVPFKRLHGPEIGGSGIGLATCKRIVELYGGRIWVESDPQNGSVFFFSLQAAEKVNHAGTYRPYRVLVVEDNPTDVRLVAEALSEHKVWHEMVVLQDGEQALQYLRNLAENAKPDLIILDLNLPKRDGFGVLNEYRASPTLSFVPIVILTSSDSPADRLRAKSIGVHAFLQKPMTLEEFIALGPRFRAILQKEYMYPPND
jgi:PAS domain S-box-containing protein